MIWFPFGLRTGSDTLTHYYLSLVGLHLSFSFTSCLSPAGQTKESRSRHVSVSVLSIPHPFLFSYYPLRCRRRERSDPERSISGEDTVRSRISCDRLFWFVLKVFVLKARVNFLLSLHMYVWILLPSTNRLFYICL